MKYGLGWKPDHLDHRDHIYKEATKPSAGADLRPLFKMPIYDQGDTSSCVAHATARPFQYLRVAQGIDYGVPSRLFIYYGARELENETSSDNGCEIRDAIKTLVNKGAPPENVWPFSASLIPKKPSQDAYAQAKHSLLIQYARVPQKLDNIRSCLNHKIPVVFGFSVFKAIDSAKVAQTGIIPMPGATEAPIGGHAVFIVADDPNHNRIVFCNSWGKDWGDDGYGYLPYDYLLDNNLADDFWAMFLVAKP